MGEAQELEVDDRLLCFGRLDPMRNLADQQVRFDSWLAGLAYCPSDDDAIVARCSLGIDLHTGSSHRTNLPQIRADLDDPVEMAELFAAPVTIHARTRDGSPTTRALAVRLDSPPLLPLEALVQSRCSIAAATSFTSLAATIAVMSTRSRFGLSSTMSAPTRGPGSESITSSTSRIVRPPGS